MFSQISWSTYWISIGSILLLYYAAILIKYFRKDIGRLLKPRSSKSPQSEKYSTDQLSENEGSDLHLKAKELLITIESVFETAHAQGYPKEELIVALSLCIRKYPELH